MDVSTYQYDSEFYDYLNQGALRGARIISSMLQRWLRLRSVADFGCGEGAWLKAWIEQGVYDVTGLDGDYVNRDRLLFSEKKFIPKNLKEPIELGRTFDLVESLEVAEHLPESCAREFVAALCRHSDRVLFAAAVPGQGGEHHVNERSYEYWRALFKEHEFVAFDCVRPLIVQQKDLPFWYRYNIMLYVHQGAIQHLPEEVTKTRVQDHRSILDVAPLPYRVRTRLLSLLPVTWMTKIAIWKKRVVGSLRKVFKLAVKTRNSQ